MSAAEPKKKARWDRVVLKLSGEAFAGDAGYGIDGEIVEQIARDVLAVRDEYLSLIHI